jgi:hypothetical protein
MSLLSVFKGWLGEAQGAVAHSLFLDDKIYHSINNVTIPTANGTTQIDHVIVSRFGLFVVETKNMKGWIFGDEHSKQWTQSLFGKKHRFQNPLHQNYRHTKALSDFLGIDHDRLHSVVMFWGEAELKTPTPPNVMTRGYATYIKSKQTVLFSDDEVAQLIEALRTGMLPQDLGHPKRPHRVTASASRQHNDLPEMWWGTDSAHSQVRPQCRTPLPRLRQLSQVPPHCCRQ